MSVPIPPAGAGINPFSSAVLQRRAELRADAEWLGTLLADPACQILLSRAGL
jgi:hypothetical protein